MRMSITLNDDPERLEVLPPITSDVEDKVMLLKVQKRAMPMPTSTGPEQKVFMDKLVAELPAFSYYLLNEWEIPADLRSERFGIKHYHHPDLLLVLKQIAPESRLLQLIDHQWPDLREGGLIPPIGWTALEVKDELTTGNDAYAIEARDLLKNSNYCGKLLTRLVDRQDGRVTDRLLNGTMRYIFHPPAEAVPVIDMAPPIEDDNDIA